MLEAARNEARYLKVKQHGNKFSYEPDKQIVPRPPRPTITMLMNMGIFQEPGDAILLRSPAPSSTRRSRWRWPSATRRWRTRTRTEPSCGSVGRLTSSVAVLK